MTEQLTSSEINERIAALEDSGFVVKGLAQHGKVAPYIGWYWREVDWGGNLKRGVSWREGKHEQI